MIKKCCFLQFFTKKMLKKMAPLSFQRCLSRWKCQEMAPGHVSVQKMSWKVIWMLEFKMAPFFSYYCLFFSKKQQKSCIDLWKMAPFTKLDVIEYCTSFSTSFSRSKAHKNTILMLITWSQKKRLHFYIFDDFLRFCSNFLLKFIITLLKKWRHFSFWRL